MHKAILIIESANDKNLSDALLAACDAKKITGLGFYIAKTKEAADALLAEHKDIAAIISFKDGKLDLNVLDNESGLGSVGMALEAGKLALEKAEDGSTEDGGGHEAVTNDEFRANQDCRDEDRCYAEADNYTVTRKRVNKSSNTGRMEALIETLDEFGLLNKTQHTCPYHDSHHESLIAYKYQIQTLTRDVDSFSDKIEKLEKAMDECPLKKDLVDTALKAKGNSKSVTIAIIGLIGTAVTVFFGLLNELFKLILPYLDKLVK